MHIIIINGNSFIFCVLTYIRTIFSKYEHHLVKYQEEARIAASEFHKQDWRSKHVCGDINEQILVWYYMMENVQIIRNVVWLTRNYIPNFQNIFFFSFFFSIYTFVIDFNAFISMFWCDSVYFNAMHLYAFCQMSNVKPPAAVLYIHQSPLMKCNQNDKCFDR